MTWSFSTLLVLWIFSFGLVGGQQDSAGLWNVSITNTSPEITYSPFFCNSSEIDCRGGWRAALDFDGLTVVSTDGPAVEGINIIPQMFFRFRALNLSMTTSPLSNATINITVITGNTILNAMANSSFGSLAIVNLRDNDTTTLSITYIQEPQIPSRLDIGNITITVKNDSASTSILPTQTLPPSISLPSIMLSSTSTSTSSPTTTSNNGEFRKKLIANAVGLTIGLGLGLTTVTCVVYLLWRHHRLAKRGAPSVEAPSLATSARRPSVSSYLSPRAKKDYMDTRWFK